MGSQVGKGGWFSGLRRNIMGFVQQVPGKASSASVSSFEGWHHPLPTVPSSVPSLVGAPLPMEGQMPVSSSMLPGVSIPASSSQGVPQQALGYGLGPHPIAPPMHVQAAVNAGSPAVQPTVMAGTEGIGPNAQASAVAAPSSGLGSPGFPKRPTAHTSGPLGGTTTGGSTGVKNPLEAMLSGIVQLQEVVADLAASKGTGSASASTSSPEVVRPGVTELVKLPSPTLEGALGFADWVHAIRPSLSDLSDSSGECWERLLSEAQDWYHNQYVPANPLARIRLKIPASTTDKESKWVRVKHRMEHLIVQSCPESVRSELSAARVSGVFPILCKLHTVYKPGGVAERSEALRQVQQPRPADSPIDAVLKLRTWRRWMTRLSDLGGSQPDAAVCIQALEAITSSVLRSLPNLAFRVNLVRASLNLDTQPTSTKVMEYFEHLLAELEGVSRVTEASPGGGTTAKGDVNKGVRQVEGRQVTGSEATATPPKEAKGAKAPSTPSSPDSGKKLCKWFHEGKGCRRGKECKFQHDWNQIPKPERADRCIACGGHGHRKDSCPNGPGLAKRDDGASSAKA